MKIVISALAIVVLMIGVQSVYAQLGAPHSEHPKVDYQLGFKWGPTIIKHNLSPNCGISNRLRSSKNDKTSFFSFCLHMAAYQGCYV
jgi:hypothetical protein